MAEESIDSSVTPNRNGKDYSATSSVASLQTGSNSKGNSTEKNDSVKSSRNKIPNYLRASTGSCHDLCKHGIKHVVEEKPNKPIQKRVAKTSPNESNLAKIKVSGEFLPKSKNSSKAFSPRRISLSGNIIRSIKNKPLPIKKSLSPDPPEIIKREIIIQPSKRVELSAKQSSSTDNKMPRIEKKPDLKSKPVNKVKPLSSYGNSDGVNGKGRTNQEVKTGQKKTTLASSTVPLSPKFSLKRTASLKTRKVENLKRSVSLSKEQKTAKGVESNKSKNEKIPEKILHIIKIGTEKDALDTTHELTDSSSKSKLKNIKASLHSDNNDSNLKRLGFKKAKNKIVGSEDIKGSSRKSTLKKGVANGKATFAEASSEKVVLKHQELERKKEARVLLNNVIEETANKLVKSRKSKVKALVGAFETVISLQEKKLS